MAQVIIYENENGNVTLVHKSDEVTIEYVLEHDCPPGALVVEEDTLPQDHAYFNAWRLVGGSVVVDEAAAQQIAINNLNNWARQEYLDRAADEVIGIQTNAARSAVSEDFATVIENGRQQILATTNTSQMTAIVVDTEEKAKTAPLEKTA